MAYVDKNSGLIVLGDGGSGGSSGGGDIQLPETDFAAADLRSGKKAVNGNGNLVTGSMPDVQLSRNKNVVSIGKGYSSGGSATIPVVALSQDGNTVSIAEGYTNGGSVSVQSSGGGSFAKVTEFSAAVDAYTAAASIQVSGFGEVDGEDFSAWNGTYDCTNLHETTTEARIFKHKTDTKYLYYGVDEDEGGDPFWGFYSNTDYISKYSAQFWSYTLASGNWKNYEMGFSAAITIVKNDVEYPAQELVLNAVKATFENGGWTSGSAVTLTGYEKEPVVDGIYLLNDDKLTGDAITFDFEKWMPTEGLLCCFPMIDKGNYIVDRVNGIRLAKFGRSWIVSDDNYVCSNGTEAVALGASRAFTLPKTFTLSMRLCSTAACGRNSCVIDFGNLNSGGYGIRAVADASTASYGFRLGGDEDNYRITEKPHNEWFTLTVVFREDTKTCKYYVNGLFFMESGEYYGDIKDAPDITLFSRYVERDYIWKDTTFVGKITDVMLWDRVLSDTEIATLVR